ncbi:Cdc6/Cdc18 family protein [Halonotius pteroides]|uniref:ATP-binding protein n=1 Tax=Halonotius pteroides TaxID=268735 RepID=A0A3A6Q5M7_9EURY|nr:AAA family ATPase [Halonotius pteroides]RJX49836.1 ATP-binding protein [Halonotius pteroides]
MELHDRIARRQRADDADPEYDAISPLGHPSEPVSRGAVIEQLLDILSPIFTADRPADGYLWGPKGAGKSAIVRALFAECSRQHGKRSTRMYTSTRAAPTTELRFLYVDSRQAQSTFALLHTVVASLSAETVPKQGIGSATMRDRLTTQLTQRDRQVVVAVDHVGDHETLDCGTVFEQLAPFRSSVSCLAIGRKEPADTAISDRSAITRVHLEPYTQHTLVEVLTSRITDAQLRSATTTDMLAEVATWANGDAHDALAALFGAAVTAGADTDTPIDDEALAAGMAAVPRPCVALGRVMSLPTSRQRIVRRLIELPEAARSSVRAAAEAISSDELDLSRATIERVLYELAEAGIVRRVKAEQPSETGRPPSRVEPRFPTLVFEQLAET